jgi:hypothetical protein
MPSTYFGSASNPADNGTLATTTITVTPPASMLAGDLVVVHAKAIGAATLSVTTTGGQTWFAEGVTSMDGGTATLFWCVFNGTWGANPVVSFGVTTCNSAIMHVFRPPSTSYTWERAQGGLVEATYTSTTTPTRAGLTTAAPDTVVLAGWRTSGVTAQTFGSLTGAGWVVTGTAQYRNLASTDMTLSYAHNLPVAAGSVVPTAQKTQSAASAGSTFLMSWVPMLMSTYTDALPESFDTVLVHYGHGVSAQHTIFGSKTANWNSYGTLIAGVAPGLDTTRKTEGAFCWKFVAGLNSGTYYNYLYKGSGASPVDKLSLTGFDLLKFDWYLETVGASCVLAVSLASGDTSDKFWTDLATAVGGGTASLSLATLTDKSDVSVELGVFANDALHGNFPTTTNTFYIDYMRAEVAVLGKSQAIMLGA